MYYNTFHVIVTHKQGASILGVRWWCATMLDSLYSPSEFHLCHNISPVNCDTRGPQQFKTQHCLTSHGSPEHTEKILQYANPTLPRSHHQVTIFACHGTTNAISLHLTLVVCKTLIRHLQDVYKRSDPTMPGRQGGTKHS